jgi:hypothetical protein
MAHAHKQGQKLKYYIPNFTTSRHATWRPRETTDKKENILHANGEHVREREEQRHYIPYCTTSQNGLHAQQTYHNPDYTASHTPISIDHPHTHDNIKIHVSTYLHAAFFRRDWIQLATTQRLDSTETLPSLYSNNTATSHKHYTNYTTQYYATKIYYEAMEPNLQRHHYTNNLHRPHTNIIFNTSYSNRSTNNTEGGAPYTTTSTLFFGLQMAPTLSLPT